MLACSALRVLYSRHKQRHGADAKREGKEMKVTKELLQIKILHIVQINGWLLAKEQEAK
jgi:hypothetical protein